jgi:hypothetical protein
MCVAPRHGLVIVADGTNKQLHMYSWADGSLVCRVGSKGRGKGKFYFDWGGLCVSPDGDSVLVAEYHNNRVQQVRIVDGEWVRFFGRGVLDKPQFVDCNADAIVVSEYCHRVSVLSWADGIVRAQFGRRGSGPGQLLFPCGVRLLADGHGLVVADLHNHRLCVFALSGDFVEAVGSEEQGLYYPFNVLEYASGASFIIANYHGHNLVRCSRDGVNVEGFGEKSGYMNPTTLAALPDGGMVCCGTRISVIRDQCHRLQWMGVCVSAALL